MFKLFTGIFAGLVSFIPFMFVVMVQRDSNEFYAGWIVIAEPFAVYLSSVYLIERFIYRILGGIRELYDLDKGYTPFFEILFGLIIVVGQIVLVFKGVKISWYRSIIFLYGILILRLRYDVITYIVNRLKGKSGSYAARHVVREFSYHTDNSVKIKEVTGKAISAESSSEPGEDAVAVVIKCGTTGNVEDSDMIIHYWIYEYEYRMFGSNKIRKHQDVIEFWASGYGEWFQKYDVGFRFPVRYNEYLPKQHIRLHNFD